MFVAELPIVLGLILATVGFVSAGKLVKLDASKVGVPKRALGIVPDANAEAFKSVVPAAFPFNPVLSIASANFLALVICIY